MLMKDRFKKLLPDLARIKRVAEEGESLYWEISRAVIDWFKGQSYVPEEIRELEQSLCDRYLCNFSVFQSLPDSWAIEQLFPVTPIHRLDQPPTRSAVLAGRTVSDLAFSVITTAAMAITGVLVGWRTESSFLEVVAGFLLLFLFGRYHRLIAARASATSTS
mgnify:CR=1 FL=1